MKINKLKQKLKFEGGEDDKSSKQMDGLKKKLKKRAREEVRNSK